MTVRHHDACLSIEVGDLYDWAVLMTATWRGEYRQAGHGEADPDTLATIQTGVQQAARGRCAHTRQALRVLVSTMGRIGRTDLAALLGELPRIEADLAAARASRTS
ncbi:hypothetical protein [Streptomyces sp. 049-1]|uniref:hypothetical protein n=1 Tax=Streptomyces sp. 049-1 TaxID=2789264 RepID=UPI00397F7DED